MAGLLPDENEQSLQQTQLGGATSLMPEQDETVMKLRAAMGAAAPKNPDKSAEIFKLQAQTGLPAEVIERNLEDVKTEAARTGFDAEAYKAKSPAMAKWLADPLNASIAKDDLDNLSNIEAFTRALSRGAEIGRKTTWAGRLASAEMWGDAPVSDRLRQLQAEIEKEPTGQGFMRQYVYRAAKIVGQLYETGQKASSTGLAYAAGGAVAGGAAGLLAGPGAPVAAPLTAAGGAAIGLTTGLTAGFLEDTYRTESGLAWLDMQKIKTADGQMVDPAIQRGAAAFVGLANAALEYAGMRMVAAPFVHTGKMLMADTARQALARPTMAKALANFGKDWAIGVAGETSTEVMQEGVNIFAEEIAKTISDPRFATLMRDPNERGAALERLAGIAEETFKGMALLGVPGAGIHASVDIARAKEAKAREEAYKALGTGVGKSKTFERMPEKVQEAIRSMTENGPLPYLYLPVDTFTQYWQDQNVDPRDVAREIFGSTRPYEEATATGADLQVPTELYATKIAPTEHNQFFARELRRAPDEMNAREGEEFLNRVKAEQESEQAKAKQSEQEAQRQQIHGEVSKQLEAAGFEKNAAGFMAEQMASVFNTQAQRMGDIAPGELFKRYGLTVNRQVETPTGEAVLNQSRRVAESPEFLRAFGQSKVVDESGSPRMFYHGSSRDIYEWRPKQAGAIYVTPDNELAEDFTKYSMDYAYRHGIADAAPVIYPLFVKAENPFDYDDGNHRARFAEWAKKMGKVAEDRAVGEYAAKQLKGFHQSLDHLLEQLAQGAWGAVEHPLVQEYVRSSGYDGFYVQEAGAKNLAVFHPEQLFNALTGENLAKEDPNVLFQTGTPWYYSELSTKISNIQQNTGTAQQWAGIIGNLQQKGVKEQEIAWSGVIEWLGLQKGKVTKQQILDYLDANGAQVTETQYGKGGKAVRQQDLPVEVALMDLEALSPETRDEMVQTHMVPPGTHFIMQYNLYSSSLADENFSDEEYAETLGATVEDLMNAPSVTAWGRTPAEAGIMLIEELEKAASNLEGLESRAGAGMAQEYERIAQEMRAIYDEDSDGNALSDEGRYGEYQLPGGQNYRELLLHLPQSALPPYFVSHNHQSGEWTVIDRETDQEVASFETEAEAKKRAEVLIFEDGVNRGYSHNPLGPGDGFQSSHWDQENILAHVRFNERTDSDGKKVLFIEEIQSDWAQQGREHGFAEPGIDPALRERLSIVPAETQPGPEEAPAGKMLWTVTEHDDDGSVVSQQRYWGADEDEALDQFIRYNQNRVPSGPFVQNTDAWVSLALKRMIRWAAENGFDRIAWTTGDQQNRRYSLSSHFREVRVFLAAPGVYDVTAVPHDDRPGHLIHKAATPDELPGIVGQELAEKIIQDVGASRSLKDITDDIKARLNAMAAEASDATIAASLRAVARNQAYGHRPYWIERQEGEVIGGVRQTGFGNKDLEPVVRGDPVLKSLLEEWDATTNHGYVSEAEPRETGANWHVYSGLDLEVGGEGMRSFYDKIVPKVANQLLSKFGGEKVKALKFGGEAALRDRFSARQDEDGNWGVYNGVGDLLEDAIDGRPMTRAQAMRTARLAAGDPEVTSELRGEQLGFDITPKLREKALTGLPLFQDKKRGFIRFDSDRKFNIGLLEGADLSTFIHESGHMYLEVMRDLVKDLQARDQATLTDKQRQILADAGIITKWMGIESLDKIEVKHHEMFARANEAYVMEGRAPSIALRGAFMRFRAWLVALYRTITNLNIRMNDEVREVFDRLYATDEEIEAAKTEGQLTPIFLTPEQAKMTPEEFAAYRERVADASRKAQEALQQKLIAEYQREKKAWWREAEAEVREDVQREFNNKREYIAMAVLRSGNLPDGEPLPQGMSKVTLDKAALEEMYGPHAESEVMKRLNRLGLYRAEGGVHPDVAAEAFGFKSGDEMVKALINLEDRRVAISREVKARMLARYGSMLLDGSIADRAREAVMNDAQAKVLHEELRALWAQSRAARPVVQQVQAQARRARAEGLDVVRSAVAPLDLIRQVAQEQVNRTRVRDLTPHKYYVAARRYGIQAADEAVKGNYEEAANAKQRQLLNLEIYRISMNAKSEAEEVVAFMRKFASPKVRERLGKAGPGYLDQIESLLSRFDFARITLRDTDKRMSLAKFIEEQEKQNFTVDLPDNIMNEAFRKPWREMTFEEIVGVRDAARHILHLSRLKNRLLMVQDKRAFDEVKDEIVAAIEANARHERKDHKETRLPQDEAVRGVSGFFASHRKLASLVRELDGFKDGGPVWNFLMRTLNRAGTQEASMHSVASKKLKKIFGVYGLKDLVAMYRKVHIPEINDSLSKQGILMVALNWGNEDNRQKLMDGYNWGPTQVQAVLSRLDKRDWEFVQNIWDFINEFWPQIEAKQRRVTGVAPQKVEASPVQTQFGEFKGGYFPLKYDDRQSPRAFGNRVKEAARLTELGGYVRSTTRRGHTIERIEGVKQPIRLDFGVILEHTHQVIHDLTHHEVLIDTNRLIANREVARAITEHFGDQVYDQFRSALTDIAAGNIPAQSQLEGAMNYIRHGTSIAAMGWNLMTGFMQFLGASQSIARIGAVNFAKGVGHWLGDAANMENSVKWVHAKSEFMRTRHDTMMREVNEIRNAIRVTGKLAPLEDSYFWLITRMQMVVDIPTWLGAYEKFMAEHGDEAKAVDQADAMVLESQGGGQIKDLARIQRGGPLLKLWTNFYSYFSVTWNMNVEAYRRTDFKNPLSVGRYATDFLLLNILPSVLATLIRAALTGDTDDPDKLREKVVREQIAYMLGMVLIARELSGVAQGFYGYEGPAGARLFSQLGNLAKQVGQGEVDEALLKSINNSAGILFHYPAGQVQRTVEGFVAISEGRTANPFALIVGPRKEDK